jgi:hypothetical protein
LKIVSARNYIINISTLFAKLEKLKWRNTFMKFIFGAKCGGIIYRPQFPCLLIEGLKKITWSKGEIGFLE